MVLLLFSLCFIKSLKMLLYPLHSFTQAILCLCAGVRPLCSGAGSEADLLLQHSSHSQHFPHIHQPIRWVFTNISGAMNTDEMPLPRKRCQFMHSNAFTRRAVTRINVLVRSTLKHNVSQLTHHRPECVHSINRFYFAFCYLSLLP